MRGATLVEALVALTLCGLLAGLAVPGAAGLRDRLIVERHAAMILEGYERARAGALASGGAAFLVVAPDSIAVLRPERTDTVTLWRIPGPATDGVALTASHPLVPVGPNAMTYGVVNGTIELRRGQVTRAVVASRPGRLRVVRRRRSRRPRTASPRAPRCRDAF